MEDERRLYQRLHLTRPLDGWFGDFPIRLLDVSASGARIEHDEEIPVGARAILRFYWRDRQVELTAETVRTAEGEAGLRFLEENAILRSVVAQSAAEVLRAQQANLDGDREANVVGDETLTAASAGVYGRGYVTWTLQDGRWTSRASLLPDQPANGFTVDASEPAEQIEVLMQTWESGDDDVRRMTRLLAELSAANVRKE